ELQPCFPRRVRHGADAPVVEEPAAVEDHALDAFFDRPLGDGFADRLGPLDVAAARRLVERALHRGLHRGRRHERLAAHVVDHLRVDVGHAPEHAEARPLGRPGDPLALPQLDADPAIVFGFDFHRLTLRPNPYFAPVFPAFFFKTSPVYRTPFCLYGSGLRKRRMFAATWPTSCRSTPVTEMCVCFSIAISMPAGMLNTTALE